MGGGDKQQIQGYTGNIDLSNRPTIFNPDGSYSTEKSFSINEDGKEILLPSIINGREVSQKKAIEYYHKTGEHLGIYPSPDAADRIAERIHSRPMTIIPETGAAKYWYVDRGAGKPFNPMENYDEQGHQDMPIPLDNRKLSDALERLGVMPKNSVPSF